jgi:hypothetical protein
MELRGRCEKGDKARKGWRLVVYLASNGRNTVISEGVRGGIAECIKRERVRSARVLRLQNVPRLLYPQLQTI